MSTMCLFDSNLEASLTHGGLMRQNAISVPLTCILQVEELKHAATTNPYGGVLLVCKDFRTMVVLFTKENSFKPTLKVLKKTIPKKTTDLFCYKSLEVRFKNLPTYLDGWFVYNMQEEFHGRQKVTAPLQGCQIDFGLLTTATNTTTWL